MEHQHKPHTPNQQPWDALGISRSTYYRHKKRDANRMKRPTSPTDEWDTSQWQEYLKIHFTAMIAQMTQIIQSVDFERIHDYDKLNFANILIDKMNQFMYATQGISLKTPTQSMLIRHPSDEVSEK